MAICKNDPPEVERSILNPDSLFELFVQERLIWEVETAVAERLEGAFGGGSLTFTATSSVIVPPE